ncbi:hypothetical protein [Ornithinimicrobium kibberense]|uniref:hypothetical protein n=1 Tax=Ornithinimicrobium kibberense TaxID=282060 RepID=UPI0036105011
MEDDGHDDRLVDLGGRCGDAGQTAGDLVLLPGRHDDEDRGERRSVVGLVPRAHGGILTRVVGGRSLRLVGRSLGVLHRVETHRELVRGPGQCRAEKLDVAGAVHHQFHLGP